MRHVSRYDEVEMFQIDVLNHASVLIRLGGVAILSDPWFEGTSFSGGWGLAYDNADAYELAAQATHLWISHWHSDHLHAPTLTKIAQRDPHISVLANTSANFAMADRLAKLGFGNLQCLAEREPVSLAPSLAVCRYPTAGIDNMLHIVGDGVSILNYNDCNLPAAGVRGLRRSIGHVDVLLANYNHAGKLFATDAPQDEKRRWYGRLAALADLFQARCVIPFASSHYYRSPFSAEQNASLLSFDDLEAFSAGDPRVCVLRIGERAVFTDRSARPAVVARQPGLTKNTADVCDYGSSVEMGELLQTCTARCEQLQRSFGALWRLVGPLRIRLADTGVVIELSLGGPARVLEHARARPHIEAHSRAIADWFGRRFGDDTFFAGAHFGIVDRDTTAIERWALISLLEASHLDPRSMLAYLGSAAGLQFLWSRREEIVASLIANRVKAAQPRL